MSNYNKQYSAEENLFGESYKEFEDFIEQHAIKNGNALDLGCGQGRDALMLAKYGYTITAVDASDVGIAQLIEKSKAQGLPITGIVADLYRFQSPNNYDAIVLDSILHFEKNDKEKELALLQKVVSMLNLGGYLFVFVHKSPKKEKTLKNWFSQLPPEYEISLERHIDYTYEEKTTAFCSTFQFFMFVIQKCKMGVSTL